jgi:hypothetical protein
MRPYQIAVCDIVHSDAQIAYLSAPLQLSHERIPCAASVAFS